MIRISLIALLPVLLLIYLAFNIKQPEIKYKDNKDYDNEIVNQYKKSGYKKGNSAWWMVEGYLGLDK